MRRTESHLSDLQQRLIECHLLLTYYTIWLATAKHTECLLFGGICTSLFEHSGESPALMQLFSMRIFKTSLTQNGVASTMKPGL